MNRGRYRSMNAPGARLRGQGAAPEPRTPIDLGIALSIYGVAADGKLVEIQDAETPASGWATLPGIGTWPTEQ